MLGRRLSSPVVMNFSIAWCVWNYKFIVILLSDNKVSETFALVDEYVSSTWGGYWGSFVVLPFVSMLGFVLLNPLAELLFYRYQWMVGRWKKTQMFRSHKVEVESVAVTSKLKDKIKELEIAVNDRDRKIKYQEEQNEIKEKKIDGLGVELNGAKNEIDGLRSDVYEARSQAKHNRAELLKLQYSDINGLGKSHLAYLLEISSLLNEKNYQSIVVHNAHKRSMMLNLRDKGFVVGDGSDVSITEKGMAACEYASAIGIDEPF